MPVMPASALTVDSLMTLAAYARCRPTLRPLEIAHRQLRSVPLGAHLRLQFEDERTVRYQLHEVLRVEQIAEPARVQREIDAYAPLLPDGRSWKATLLLEWTDAALRRRELPRSAGVAECVFVQVAGHDRVYAVADEDLDATRPRPVMAVHFLRFRLTPPMCAAVQDGAAVRLGCDHPVCTAEVAIAPATRASLAGDLAAQVAM